MKRIVSRKVWDRVPNTDVKPIADRAEFFNRNAPVGFTGTMMLDYGQVEGGFVPMKSVGPRIEEVEEEYLSVGELRAALASVPDDAPVKTQDSEYGYGEATAVHYDGESVKIE